MKIMPKSLFFSCDLFFPGVRQGRVITPPVAHANEQTQDGVLVYNEGPASFHCSFGSFQVC